MIYAWKTFLVVLFEGFVTLAVQMLTIRQLNPFVGNSILVTSSVVGIMLLFLALGYQRGGDHGKNYRKILIRNFMIAGGLCSIGLSYGFLSYFFTLDIPLMVRLYLYLLCVTAPIVYYLGQTIPIITNLAKAARVGKISGTTLFLSTFGSFLGSILTAALLMPYLGVAATIFISVSILAVLLVLLSWEGIQSRGYPLLIRDSIVAVLLCAIAWVFNVSIEKDVFVRTTQHANYRVVKDHIYHSPDSNDSFVGELLEVNNSHSSFIGNGSQRELFWYMSTFRRVVFDELDISNGEILVIGAGAFSASAGEDNGNSFTYVDIDPSVKEVVDSNMRHQVKDFFVGDDGRSFLRNNNKRYDVILVDAFTSTHTIPEHLVTKEFFDLVKQRLKKNGIMAINLIGKPFERDGFLPSVVATINDVYGYCPSSTSRFTRRQMANVAMFCLAGEKEKGNIAGYTDDLNRAAWDIAFEH